MLTMEFVVIVLQLIIATKENWCKISQGDFARSNGSKKDKLPFKLEQYLTYYEDKDYDLGRTHQSG
jgi:hypothetical protein